MYGTVHKKIIFAETSFIEIYRIVLKTTTLHWKSICAMQRFETTGMIYRKITRKHTTC